GESGRVGALPRREAADLDQASRAADRRRLRQRLRAAETPRRDPDRRRGGGARRARFCGAERRARGAHRGAGQIHPDERAAGHERAAQRRHDAHGHGGGRERRAARRAPCGAARAQRAAGARGRARRRAPGLRRIAAHHQRAVGRDHAPANAARHDLQLAHLEAAQHRRADEGSRMTRALLVCPEPLGHKQPAGVGIRFLEMARVLRADGHDVTLVSPPIVPERFRELTAAHDVAVVQGHIGNELFAHGQRIPTVVDLYDPYIIENLHYHERLPQAFPHDHETLMQSLQRGDFFLCASDAQRHFYLGALLAAGRLNPDAFARDPTLLELIAVAPFGVPPPRPRATHDRSSPRVLFGGIYDWYDPILAIEAVATARGKSSRMTLTFNTHPNPELTPQGKLTEAMQHVRRRSYEFVRFEPWVPYEERGAYYDQFALALL